MARGFTIKILMDLAKSIGANPQKFMGTRTNITFLGKGPTKNPLFQQPLDFLGPEGRGITAEALGDRGKLISAIEDAMGYATAGKLNPIQTEMLSGNLKGIYEILHPPVLPSASVTNIASGIEGLRRFPKETHKFFGRPLKSKDFAEIDELVKRGKLPEPGIEGIKQRMEKIKGMSDKLAQMEKERLAIYGKGKTPSQLPQKTYAARATMYRLLDEPATKEGVGLTLREIMSKQDLKWLLEGGGGTEGDPIAMFTKYFGNAATKRLPTATTPAVIDNFAKQIIRMKDRMGRRIDDPFFRREDLDFAGGGLAHILQVPRTGYFQGALADTEQGKAMSPGTSAQGGTHEGGYGRDDVPLGNNTVVPKTNWITKSNISPIVETKKSSFGFNLPSGKVGLQALTNLGRIRATTDLSHLLQGDDLEPTFTYDQQMGPVDINAMYSPDVKNISATLNKGNFSGGATYNPDTGTNFGIQYKRTFKKGGLARILEV